MKQIPKGNIQQAYERPTFWDVVSVTILMLISIWATGAILGWW